MRLDTGTPLHDECVLIREKCPIRFLISTENGFYVLLFSRAPQHDDQCLNRFMMEHIDVSLPGVRQFTEAWIFLHVSYVKVDFTRSDQRAACRLTTAFLSLVTVSSLQRVVRRLMKASLPFVTTWRSGTDYLQVLSSLGACWLVGQLHLALEGGTDYWKAARCGAALLGTGRWYGPLESVSVAAVTG